MKQYRITSADFVTSGESLEPDAILSPEDLALVKQLVNPNLPQFWQSQPELPRTPLRERKYDSNK